ncbi:hypothetical protein Pelo_18565 [Pelomyxa schiedti]|nr:hypothetical protein Pelo_18565 [Pelomyxa schiedti]
MTQPLSVQSRVSRCAVPWDLIVAYLNWICAQDGKVATSKAWESLEALESQVSGGTSLQKGLKTLHTASMRGRTFDSSLTAPSYAS